MKLLYLVESGESKFLVFDEMSDKISTKYGDDTIIGRIGGIFYDFLAKRNERREAFGGRKFDVVLDNGEVEKCEGQWWDYQDCYITISHCDCDDNSLFSDRIKNSIEPELWISLDVITNYLPDIKQNHLSQ